MNELLFLGICGSLRLASRNMGLLRSCAGHLPPGIRFEIADISALPFYNEDRKKPEAVTALAAQVRKADAFVFACPEYNYSLAPALKNALDWLSREPAPTPLYGKPGCVLGAGGGMGTCRSQNHLRQVCVYLNIQLLDKPEFFSNAFSSAFSEEGDLIDPALERRLGEMMEALAAWTRLLQGCGERG